MRTLIRANVRDKQCILRNYVYVQMIKGGAISHLETMFRLGHSGMHLPSDNSCPGTTYMAKRMVGLAEADDHRLHVC